MDVGTADIEEDGVLLGGAAGLALPGVEEADAAGNDVAELAVVPGHRGLQPIDERGLGHQGQDAHVAVAAAADQVPVDGHRLGIVTTRGLELEAHDAIQSVRRTRRLHHRLEQQVAVGQGHGDLAQGTRQGGGCEGLDGIDPIGDDVVVEGGQAAVDHARAADRRAAQLDRRDHWAYT